MKLLLFLLSTIILFTTSCSKHRGKSSTPPLTPLTGAWVKPLSANCYFEINFDELGTYEVRNDCLTVMDKTSKQALDLSAAGSDGAISVFVREAWRGSYHTTDNVVIFDPPQSSSCPSDTDLLKSTKTSSYFSIDKGSLILKYGDTSISLAKIEVSKIDTSENGAYNATFTSPKGTMVVNHGCLSKPANERSFQPKKGG